MRNLAKFHRLKNCDFIRESKMVELNLKKIDQTITYFTLEINK